MINPILELAIQKSELWKLKSEFRNQKSETKIQKSESTIEKSEIKSLIFEMPLVISSSDNHGLTQFAVIVHIFPSGGG